ncbi:MAG: AAA family ATPase [Treponemataceae bacterium]|nr:MAG: AAA family ATPase [Treponemataceae bacterium]
MFLISLEIFGFKSFADRVKIEFSDGITALLGPNGCGKSNVVDAIKWALGERSPKNMRAEKMEDVIFSGTENRRPLNVAEVTLIINNESKALPADKILQIEVNPSEVAIRRRFFRSGENEFYINNVPVIQKKIQELFWDTGVGKAAYSVMEQGKIDQILSSKPEDRRYLFEEAAGITRNKMEWLEAERKLARAEENLRQLDILQADLKRSHDSLKVQAEKAAKYRKLRDEIFYLELDTQLLKLKGFVSDCAKFQEDFKTAEAAREKVRAEIDEITKTVSANLDAVNEMETALSSLQKEIYGLHATKLEKQKLAKQWIERKSELKSKIAALDSREASLADKIDALADDIGGLEAGLFDKRKRIADAEKNIAEFQNNISLAEKQIVDNDAQSSRQEKMIFELVEKRKNLQKDLILITEDIVTELDSRLKDAGYSSGVCAAAKEKVFEILGKLSALASGRKALFSDFISLAEPDPRDAKDWAQKALTAFEEISALSANLEDAINTYTNSTPAFINEFLAPEGIITKKRAIDRLIQEGETGEQASRTRINELKAENTAVSGKIGEYRATLDELKLREVQMQTQIEGEENQIKLLKRELTAQEYSLRETQNERGAEESRLRETEENIEETESELADIERKGTSMAAELETLEQNILRKNDDVSGKREWLVKKTEEAAAQQRRVEKIDIQIKTAEIEIKNVKESFMDIHSRDLMEFEERMYTITAKMPVLREQLSAKRQEVKDLGNVNLAAVEEFAEVKERYEFIAGQIADTKAAKNDMTQFAAEIRSKSAERFISAFTKIHKNFHNMFRKLFGGGAAQVRFADPDNVLESGIEIYAQPPGKKLENIALLSGGEKTMTAVALLFATYRVHPSPFCLLDEIDAALDEKNVGHFVNALREFSRASQYLVISHNKKTAACAGTLLGITMEEHGVSKLVSLKVDRRENAALFERHSEYAEEGGFTEEDAGTEEDVPAYPPVQSAETDSGYPLLVSNEQDAGNFEKEAAP